MSNTIQVVNKLDAIARSRGCEVEQVAISLERREAALIFLHKDSEVYSAHSYSWWDGEALPNSTHWGAYDLNLDTARKVWAEKSRQFMEGWK